ncbi:MAG: xanthine dehydrogenase family protein subunit M [Chloroflexi bacterium]|nr:xanthine dehydrogenase family protein subunit M [Chloroflexota bacterium]
MRAFEYFDAASVAEAVKLLKAEPDGAIFAGGTDLLVLMKNRVANPRLLINVKTIPNLDGIEEDSLGGLTIGPLATLARLGGHELVQREHPVLAQAVAVAASPQIRNVATVGGNICQRPRCWYYRGSFDCFLKGGNHCFAKDGRNRHHRIFGDSPCHAVNPSDLAPPLVALGASLTLQGPRLRRQVPAADFFAAPEQGSLNQNVLGHGEMITAISVPKQPDGSRGIYMKAMERKAWSFAQASVAIQLARREDEVTDVRIVLGGVAPTPWRAAAAEEVLHGKVPTPDLIDLASGAASAGAHPLSDNAYKVRLAGALVKRGLQTLLAGQTDSSP